MLINKEDIIKKVYEQISNIYNLGKEEVSILEMEETILLYYNTSGYNYKSIDEILYKLI